MLETKSFSVTIKRPHGKHTTLDCGSTGNKLRGECRIEEGGEDYKNSAEITIYGVSPNTLKDFSSLALHQDKRIQKPETVIISVGDRILFSGDTFLTHADFSDFPNISLSISAVFGFSAALVRHDPTYIKAKNKTRFVDAAGKLLDTLNKDLGLTDQKAKIALKCGQEAKTMVCPDITLTGTAIDKLQRLAAGLRLHQVIDHTGAYFWVPGKSYPPDFVRPKPEVNQANGLVGYPVFYNEGINFTTSKFLWKVGDYVSVKSGVPFASGKYFIMRQKIELSTLPGGKWQSEYNAIYAV